MQLYADIVLPLAQPVYTFAVPGGTDVAAGQAVAVQFGARKFYTGIVWRVHDRRPDFKTVKPIQRVLYDAPLLSAQQMSLWEWIASYYMCSLGEVMRVALPALMKPSGDTEEEFSGDEFRPRTECYVSLAAELRDEGRFHEVCEKIERRAPKQYEALLELAAAGDETRIATGEVARRLLRADYAVLHALERKKYIVCTQRERSVERGESAFRLPELTAHQLTALNALREQFAAGKTTALLQGVTGSGKTEIYIHLIAEVLSRGGDVLLLVPEIALTAQLIERMERIFGSRVTPYHSKLTNRRRTETYLRLNRSDGGEFVVGVRSSVFLPLKHLQLIVVDEEHDASYKQTEPAPRYNARDCAVVTARLFGGRTLLGSATPSLETWLNARSGKYGRAVLGERYGGARPPEVLISDTLRAVKPESGDAGSPRVPCRIPAGTPFVLSCRSLSDTNGLVLISNNSAGYYHVTGTEVKCTAGEEIVDLKFAVKLAVAAGASVAIEAPQIEIGKAATGYEPYRLETAEATGEAQRLVPPGAAVNLSRGDGGTLTASCR